MVRISENEPEAANGNDAPSREPSRFTWVQITLHWLIALLVIEQYATSAAILRIHAYRPLGKGPDPSDLPLHLVHTRVGLLILALVALRVALRIVYGSPEWTSPLPIWRRRLATSVQYGLYGVLLAQPATGAIASYFWWPMSAAHRALFVALLVLLAAHLAGAALSFARRPHETLFRITGLLTSVTRSEVQGGAP